MSKFDTSNSHPLFVPVSIETGRAWCLGDIGWIDPEKHFMIEGVCLYIGNVLNREDLFRSYEVWKQWPWSPKLVILSTHSKGIYNLAMNCGFLKCCVEDPSRFEGTRFVGEYGNIKQMVSKFARINQKQLCRQSKNSLCSSLAQPLAH